MARTQQRIRAARRETGQADRLTVGHGETEEQEQKRYQLAEKALNGDVNSIIEYLTKYGGKEWQQ